MTKPVVTFTAAPAGWRIYEIWYEDASDPSLTETAMIGWNTYVHVNPQNEDEPFVMIMPVEMTSEGDTAEYTQQFHKGSLVGFYAPGRPVPTQDVVNAYRKATKASEDDAERLAVQAIQKFNSLSVEFR